MNQLVEPPGVHPYMYCPKGCCFSLSRFVYSWDIDFGHLVSNRVFFLHSSLELGMFLRSYFFVIIGNALLKDFYIGLNQGIYYKGGLRQGIAHPTQVFW